MHSLRFLFLALCLALAQSAYPPPNPDSAAASEKGYLRDDFFTSEDVFQNKALETACDAGGDIARFCSDVPQGDDRVRRCLQDHKNDADMSSACKEAVIEDELDSAGHAALINVALCAKDMLNNVPQCNPSNHNDKTKIIACLIEHKDELTDPTCQAEVFHAEKEEASDFRLDPELYAGCHSDQIGLCPNVRPGKGRVHRCLRKNFQRLSKFCLRKEFEEAVREARDVRLKPTLVIACSVDMKKFCPKVQKGTGGDGVSSEDDTTGGGGGMIAWSVSQFLSLSPPPPFFSFFHGCTMAFTFSILKKTLIHESHWTDPASATTRMTMKCRRCARASSRPTRSLPQRT